MLNPLLADTPDSLEAAAAVPRSSFDPRRQQSEGGDEPQRLGENMRSKSPAGATSSYPVDERESRVPGLEFYCGV